MSYTNLDPMATAAALQSADLAEPDLVLLDVRSPGEFRSHRIDGAILIPVDQIASRHHELDRQKPLLVICEHGVRSVAACEILHEAGFTQLTNVTGGMAHWIAAGLEYVRGD